MPNGDRFYFGEMTRQNMTNKTKDEGWHLNDYDSSAFVAFVLFYCVGILAFIWAYNSGRK